MFSCLLSQPSPCTPAKHQQGGEEVGNSIPQTQQGTDCSRPCRCQLHRPGSNIAGTCQSDSEFNRACPLHASCRDVGSACPGASAMAAHIVAAIAAAPRAKLPFILERHAKPAGKVVASDEGRDMAGGASTPQSINLSGVYRVSASSGQGNGGRSTPGPAARRTRACCIAWGTGTVGG